MHSPYLKSVHHMSNILERFSSRQLPVKAYNVKIKKKKLSLGADTRSQMDRETGPLHKTFSFLIAKKHLT